MFWPIVACVLLPWLLVYLGLHVVQRGIIFIDIAMAQMASLGICLAVLFHLDLQGWATFGIALGFTLIGGAIFSLTGNVRAKSRRKRSLEFLMLLQPGDTAKLTGDVVQQLVGSGMASIDDPRMSEEAAIIDKAAALGLPQKIRELAAFALPKKDRWSVRPKDSEANE